MIMMLMTATTTTTTTTWYHHHHHHHYLILLHPDIGRGRGGNGLGLLRGGGANPQVPCRIVQYGQLWHLNSHGEMSIVSYVRPGLARWVSVLNC